ncbi:tRNA pseudouridine(55) synthase TruB [Aliamphritea spongicola]|nr:tRNA pseudouridine(55) synthase TruB [Aliamphritea spongicola]
MQLESPEAKALVRILTEDDEFLGIGEVTEGGRLLSRRLLNTQNKV